MWPARQLLCADLYSAAEYSWASTTVSAGNQAFNIVNGDIFRWSWLWPEIASWFGVEPIGFDGTIHPLEKELAGDGPVWKEITNKYNLKEPLLNRLASAWHTDLDLGRPIEVMTDMSKIKRRGNLRRAQMELES